jgi:membrane carboxypeptidase/penicillin-binding protein PbpC
VPPVAITRIVDFNGNLVYEYKPPAGEQVVRPEHAYLIASILSDNAARTPAFGPDSVLNLPFQVAAKTGTTNDFRDNWTLGFIPELAVGVWVGNADYTPMQNVTGLTGAAPIWSEYMQAAVKSVTGGNPSAFSRPPGVIERVICAISGAEPSGDCSSGCCRRPATAAASQDLWKKVVIDTWTGLEASPACDEYTDEKKAVNVTDPWAVKWIRRDPAGEAWADQYGFSSPIFFVPQRQCKAEDPHPILEFSSPRDGDTISQSPLEIFAKAGATGDFDSYELSYGLGDDPVDWDSLEQDGAPANDSTKIYEWDLRELPADGYSAPGGQEHP